MNKKLLTLIALVLFAGCLALQAQIDEKKSIILKLKDATLIPTIKSMNKSAVIERIFPHSPKFEERHREFGLHLWYIVHPKNEKECIELYKQLIYLPEVEKATISRPTLIPQYNTEQYMGDNATPRSRTMLPVNDPLYNSQWHYQNRLSSGGIDINLEKGWELEKGNRKVIVAVIDEGIDINHEDLKNNIWVNEKELNGKPGVDDDGNGYIDDINGYNFVNNMPNISPAYHGTHVAGTIAAINNNGIGVCGIAGGDGKESGVRLMSCEILRSSSTSTRQDMKAQYYNLYLAKAFIYAADNGAVIAQNSWSDQYEDDQEIVAVGVNYFMAVAGRYNNSPMKGGLVVWAAGNNNSSSPGKPETNPDIQKKNLIIVGSLTPQGIKASYSNYGSWVDISAPGGEDSFQMVLSCIPNNHYGYMAGTSMACPHVSGIAALAVSKFGKENFTPQEVKHRILTSIYDINRYNEGRPEWNLMGVGGVDSWKTLLDNQQLPPQRTTGIYFKYNTSRITSVSWPMASDIDDQAIDSCRVYHSTLPFTAESLPSEYISIHTAGFNAGDTVTCLLPTTPPNKHMYVAVMGIDRWGNKSEISEIIQSPTLDNRPVIYSKYSHNEFNAYVTEHLVLDFELLTANSRECLLYLHTDTDKKELQLTQDNKFTIDILPNEKSIGKHVLKLIAIDKMNPLLADTMQLICHIHPQLQKDIPAPVLRPGKSLDVFTKELKGSISIDLNDYFIDPSGLDFFMWYDSKNDMELDFFSHGMKAQMENNIIHIEYEFNSELIELGPTNWIILTPINLQNTYLKSIIPFIEITYTGISKVENVIEPAIDIYPTIVTEILTMTSDQDIEKITIYNLSGNLMLDAIRPGNSLSIGSLPEGIYMAKINTATTTIVKRIIKQSK